MKQSKCLITFVFGLSIMLLISAVPALSVPPTVDYSAVATEANCSALQGYVAGLTDATFNKPVTNVTATWKTSTSGPTSGRTYLPGDGMDLAGNAVSCNSAYNLERKIPDERRRWLGWQP